MNGGLLPGNFSEVTDVLSIDDYCFLSIITDELGDITEFVFEPFKSVYHPVVRVFCDPGDFVLVFGLEAIGLYSGLVLRKLREPNPLARTVVGCV